MSMIINLDLFISKIDQINNKFRTIQQSIGYENNLSLNKQST
jgi:hypothetical protein